MNSEVLQSTQEDAPTSGSAVCRTCGLNKNWAASRRLMTRSEVDKYLALSSDQVQSLIKTHQITAIRIRGEERFDSRALDLLIETYTATARRRAG